MDRIKDLMGPAFVILELVMHVYLSIYLTFHWTNWTIWGFTAFETLGFIYLLIIGQAKHHHKKQPSISERHMRHYQYCGCLGDLAVCCNPQCPCHWED